ncbi:MAG TPA: DUF2267 domain-containing protein [Candidatus Binatia bacterium]
MNTPSFVRSVAESLHSDRRHARALTGVVFQELRDRLPADASAGFAARLPPGLKRLWMVTPPPVSDLSYKLELLGEVMQQGALRDSTEAEHAVVAVFATLQHFFGEVTDPEGILAELVHQLTPDLAILWREATQVAVVSPDVRPPRRAPQRARGRTRAPRVIAEVSA